MAIDPMTYKKYSGRTGDPYSRMGAALAQSDAQTSNREATRAAGERRWVSPVERLKAQLMGWALVAGLIGFVILLWAIFG